MAELNVQQQNLVKELRQAYPELKSYSDEQILTIYNQQLANVQLSEDERISIMSGRNGVSNDGVGLQVETTQAVELTKEQENELLSALTKRINDVTVNTQKAEEENGFLGKAWNWAKNTALLDWCTDSTNDIKKAQQADLKALESGNIKEAFKQITGLDYTVENVNKFLNNEIQTTSEQALNGYKEGQDMASDVVADIFSGIAAVGIYTAAVALAPVSGGASIAVGIAAATASGAAIKTGIKFADTVSSEREYTSDNLKRDLATGAFSGVLAPITGGMGGAVGKTVATKMGVQAVKQVGKEVADTVVESGIKQGIKTALTNPTGYEYVGGTLLKRSLAFGAEMATDGAIGGAVDNAFRTAYDGGSLENVGNAALQGFVGGAIMSPIIGGGMKFAGKGAQKIFGKDNVQIDAQGNRVRVNDDGTIVRIDSDGNVIPDAVVKETLEEIDDNLAKETAKVEPPSYEGVIARIKKLHEMGDDGFDDVKFQEFLGYMDTCYKNKTFNEEQIKLLDLFIENKIEFNDYIETGLRSVNKDNIIIAERLLNTPEKITINGKEFDCKKPRLINVCEVLRDCTNKEECDFALQLIDNGQLYRKTMSNLENGVSDLQGRRVLNLKYKAELDIAKLENAIGNYKRYPEITKMFIENGFNINTRDIEFFGSNTDLTLEQKKIALRLESLKNKKDKKAFYIGELIDECERLKQQDASATTVATPCLDMLKKMSEEDFKLVEEIFTNSNNNKYTAYKIMDVLNSTKELYPAKYDLIKDLMRKNVIIQDSSDLQKFFEVPEEEQRKIFNIINKNQDVIDRFPANIMHINDSYIEKARIFMGAEDVTEVLPNYLITGILTTDEIPIPSLKTSLEATNLVSENLVKREKKIKAQIFSLAIIKDRGLVSETAFNDYIQALGKLENVEDPTFKRLLEGLGNAVGVLLTSKQDITMSKNLDFLLKRDLSKYTDDQLAKILYSSDIDLERNEQILNNILTTDKEKIIKVLTNKCQNTCPTFVKYVEELLNTPEKATELLFIHNLSTDVLTNDLYSVAKLFSYVNDKPQDYINGKYSEKVLEVLKKERKYGTDEMLLETLSSAEKDALNEIKASIKRNFDDKITDILDAVTATDLETVKLLLDKRFDAFNTELHSLTMFTPEKKNLLANLIRNGKRINKNGLPDKLTGQQKVDLINIVKCSQEIEASCGVKFDYEKYMTPTQGKAFVFNIEALQKDLFEQILIRNGMSADEIAKLKPEDLAWDYTRISLLAKSIYMDEGELATLVNEASKGNFKQFITDPTNPHGKANLETKTRFEELGLDYAKWQTGPEAQTFKIGGQEYTVKLWNRVPQESLFDGSYTTCCTALDGGNGGSMANYMLNTAINVVEVKDKNGKVVAMSRCYIADVGGKQTFVIENIEANNQLIARMTDNGTTANLVEGLHNYLKDFATEVGGEDMPVYMSTSFAKVSYPFKDNFKAVQKPVKLTGEISKNQIYLNTYCGYVDANNLTKPAEFYIVRE